MKSILKSLLSPFYLLAYSFLLVTIISTTTGYTQNKARARDIGIPFEGTPGPFNAITDVDGVEVGHATLIRGEGHLVVGQGPVRTGVTAVFPLGKTATEGVTAGWFRFNGDGEMTGTVFLEEFGELYGPVMITNTLSVGTVHAAVIAWSREHFQDEDVLLSRALPVVAETWDGFLNDIYGQHVAEKDVFKAMNSAKGGPVEEGNVGGGTGMRTNQFKAGIGTSSRLVTTRHGQFTIGVLVQSNYGQRPELRVAGIPVGIEITDLMPVAGSREKPEGNSIIAVVATDAPLLPVQLDRLARRVILGLGRNGSTGGGGSGDLFLAFSTGNRLKPYDTEARQLKMITDIDPLFKGTVQATEEAIINALVAGETMQGIDGNVIYAIPHDRLQNVLEKYNRLKQ